jgi:hypothetical protein
VVEVGVAVGGGSVWLMRDPLETWVTTSEMVKVLVLVDVALKIGVLTTAVSVT